VRRCVVRRLVRCYLISCLVAVFVCSYWKINFSQSITDSIDDLDINVEDPETWVFWWFRFDHIIRRHFAVVCY